MASCRPESEIYYRCFATQVWTRIKLQQHGFLVQGQEIVKHLHRKLTISSQKRSQHFCFLLHFWQTFTPCSPRTRGLQPLLKPNPSQRHHNPESKPRSTPKTKQPTKKEHAPGGSNNSSQPFKKLQPTQVPCPVSSGIPIASPSVSAPQHFAPWPAWREAASPASLTSEAPMRRGSGVYTFWKLTFVHRKLTISMAIFHSYFSHYQVETCLKHD